MRPIRFPCTYLLISASLILALKPSASAAPPSNDNFANRTVLSGTPAIGSADNTDATRESFEGGTGEATVWFSWTTPTDGTVTINTQGTRFDHALSVYNGDSIDTLMLVARSRDQISAEVSFPAAAGTTFQVAVGYSYISGGGYPGSHGPVKVNIKLGPSTIPSPVVIGTPSAANDNFVSRTTLAGPVVSGIGYNTVATRESFEAENGEDTLWWTWTAPTNGNVTINTQGSKFSAHLVVYNGSTIDSLKIVGSYRDTINAQVSFPTVAGTVYQISVGYTYITGGNFNSLGAAVLNINLGASTIAAPVVIGSQAAANDNFANAQNLGSNPVVSGFGFNPSASNETLEARDHGDRSLWWSWTAPQSGTLNVSFDGTTFRLGADILVGENLSNLSQASGIENTGANSVALPVTGGELYRFVIGSTNGVGTAILNLNYVPSLATITIIAEKGTAYEEGGQVGYFTITRTGDISKTLRVGYTIKGNAQGGYDYVRLQGTAKIKAGKSSARLIVTPIDHGDGGGGGGKVSVKLTLKPGSGYEVGTASSAKVKISRRH